MALNSPLANPQALVSKINNLSAEAIAVDKGFDRSTRDAAELAAKYNTNFAIVSELQASTKKIREDWVSILLQTRDAASALSAWYKRFGEVFLSLVDDIETEDDAKEVIQEFNNFSRESNPLSEFHLDKTPGVKNAFNEVEELARKESNHVVDVLKKATAKDVKKIVDDLNQELVPVKAGVGKVRQALDSYAVKLD